MRSIMEPFRNCNFLPAIQWVECNASEKRDLLFRLHTEHIFQLLKIGIVYMYINLVKLY